MSNVVVNRLKILKIEVLLGDVAKNKEWGDVAKNKENGVMLLKTEIR